MATVRQVALVLILGVPLAHAANDVPDWVRQVVSGAVPTYPVKVTAAVLLQEEAVTVDADGRRVMRERGVIKILQPGGDRISASRTYNSKNGRIRDFQGWILPPAGKPIIFAKSNILDQALSEGDVYDESRVKLMQFGTNPPGTFVAWEVTEEERSVFTQDAYAFQGRLPVLASRYNLTLPSGWEAKGVLFNSNPQEPQVSGNTYVWELRNLPFREREEYSPRLSALVPRLAVSYFPPADNRVGLRGLKDWTAVSAWLSKLVEPAAEPTDS